MNTKDIKTDKNGTRYYQDKETMKLKFECQHCGNWFETSRKFNQKYCSNSCRSASSLINVKKRNPKKRKKNLSSEEITKLIDTEVNKVNIKLENLEKKYLHLIQNLRGDLTRIDNLIYKDYATIKYVNQNYLKHDVISSFEENFEVYSKQISELKDSIHSRELLNNLIQKGIKSYFHEEKILKERQDRLSRIDEEIDLEGIMREVINTKKNNRNH